jgi:hypothetical protein
MGSGDFWLVPGPPIQAAKSVIWSAACVLRGTIYNRQRMDSPLLQVALRILAGIASLWCFVMAITWYRATKEMQRTGNARRLPFPFPSDFMWLDMIMMSIRRNPRVPPELQEKYERMEFVSIINGNLLRAFSLLIFALLGLLFAIGRLMVR